MPLKTPNSSSSKKSKPAPKAKGKTSKPARRKAKAAPPSQPVVQLSWWSTLSDERKLDVVGAIMSVAGILTI
ncbi:MAG TPA: hypothetical protein VLA72_10335, partial [Anaerolineales bacterium]|nr:hypothetical protein [Anaerolineales bacterium]